MLPPQSTKPPIPEPPSAAPPGPTSAVLLLRRSSGAASFAVAPVASPVVASPTEYDGRMQLERIAAGATAAGTRRRSVAS